MKIKSLQINKTALIFIIVSFIFVFIIWVTRVDVMSQDRQVIRDIKMSEKPTDKQDKNDDGIQEYIDILNDCKQDIPASKKINAIKQLGFANVERAIPVLIKYLDYEDVSKRPTENAIDLYDGISTPAGRYPAIGALSQFGKQSLSDLSNVVEKEELNSTKSKNARQTIQYIFLEGNLIDGILYLEKAASASKVPNGSERLQATAQELRKIWKKLKD